MPRLTLLRSLAALGGLVFAGQAAFSLPGATTTVKVKPGDTLWALSRRYHVDLNQLAAVNGMKLSNILYAGRILVLPGSGSVSSPVGGAPAPSATNPAATNPAPVPPPVPPRHFTAAELAQMRSFCQVYRPPVQPVGVLPSGLAGSPDRIALRPLFVKWGRAYGVPPDLVEAVAWQESGWQNNVVSPANAQGIGQLLPETAAFLNRLMGTSLQLTVPEDNIRMEARMLSALLASTGGRVCDAVASYYQGLGALQDIGVLPESQVYVQSVLSLWPRFR
jgi:hypothetical protein